MTLLLAAELQSWGELKVSLPSTLQRGAPLPQDLPQILYFTARETSEILYEGKPSDPVGSFAALSSGKLDTSWLHPVRTGPFWYIVSFSC